MTTNALAIPEAVTMAEMLVKSGYLPQAVKTPQQAFAIITLGNELGIGAWAALNGINVIQGKPTVSPQLMLSLIYSSGKAESITIDDGNGTAVSTVTMKRRGMEAYTYTFSDDDAKAMGLLGKDNWRKQPVIMRKWRAVAGCARVVFPDVIMGMYTPDEIAPDLHVSIDGDLLDTPQSSQKPAHDVDGVVIEEPAANGHSGAHKPGKWASEKAVTKLMTAARDEYPDVTWTEVRTAAGVDGDEPDAWNVFPTAQAAYDVMMAALDKATEQPAKDGAAALIKDVEALEMKYIEGR